ncbi:MAG: TMEM175 family protein [Ferruginibacter sp.]
MHKNRLEAFSDGVLAIIITIMVLELKIPSTQDFIGFQHVVHEVLGYLLSFVYIGIYWNNHHHLLHKAEKIDGRTMWANLHLLFWLSLIPFATRWMAESNYSHWPVAAYGFVLFMSGIAYYLLSESLKKLHGKDSELSMALKKNGKEITSIVLNLVSIIVAFFIPAISLTIFGLIALTWLIPDKRLEKK